MISKDKKGGIFKTWSALWQIIKVSFDNAKPEEIISQIQNLDFWELDNDDREKVFCYYMAQCLANFFAYEKELDAGSQSKKAFIQATQIK